MKVLGFNIPDEWILEDNEWHNITIEYKRTNPYVLVRIDGNPGQVCYFEERDVK